MSRETGYELKGASVVGKLWSSLFGRVVTDRQSPTAPDEPEKRAVEEPGLGMKLTGDPHPLDRLVSVQPNTVVVIFEQDSVPRLKFPGEYLTPGLLPSLRPVQVLAVNTAPVKLDVTVDHLVTLDGHEIERCLVRVTVQLTDRDNYASVAGLAAEYGTELEAYLLQRVETEVAMEMHAAVKMNRLADLRRQTVQQVLAERWLPRSFAGGALVRREFAVIEVSWPKDSAVSVPIAQTSAPKVDQSASAFKPAPPVPIAPAPLALFVTELTMDARLRRIWRRYAEPELRAIAGAKVGNSATVVAVVDREPGAYEGSRLREDFGIHFEDRNVHFVAAVADSYEDLVRAWFKQVDGSPGRLVSVRSVGDDSILRIGVDHALRSAEERARGLSVGTQADREALRRLVPHERVEFVAADTTG
ncbi:MAG TPA: hypothetical protein VNB87_13040 [Propionibacteriaceae bacterium]|jgi:hypothetical protein|nr:hypothetical protein [Propionibacteriaceae bacterium]